MTMKLQTATYDQIMHRNNLKKISKDFMLERGMFAIIFVLIKNGLRQLYNRGRIYLRTIKKKVQKKIESYRSN